MLSLAPKLLINVIFSTDMSLHILSGEFRELNSLMKISGFSFSSGPLDSLKLTGVMHVTQHAFFLTELLPGSEQMAAKCATAVCVQERTHADRLNRASFDVRQKCSLQTNQKN